MRTLLLNDSRCEKHIGSELTVRGLLAQCDRVGLRIIRTWPVTALDDPQLTRSSLDDFDLLLINGEGSMHDDQPKALSLARAGELAAQAGKRVVLVNSVWQNNQEANRLLPRLDLIACRESLSTEAVTQTGSFAQIVPDAILSLNPPTIQTTLDRHGIIVTDSVYGSVTRRLAWLACRHRYSFAPLRLGIMDGLRRRRLLTLAVSLRCPPVLNPLSEDFMQQLGEAEAVITGRFHAVCLCFLLGVPVAAVASNTHKVAGLYRDAGCNPDLVRQWPGRTRRLSLRQFLPQLEEVAARRDAIRRYVTEAKAGIQAFFDRIAALASTRRVA